MKPKTLLFALGVLVFVTANVRAPIASAQSDVPVTAHGVGVIADINEKSSTLKIGDRTYNIDRSTKIYSPSREPLNLKSLRPGMRMMFKTDSARKTTITEIHLLRSH